MKAQELYKKLDNDFITDKMSDNWIEYMDSVADYLSDNFKKREMGLVCDFSEEINSVYTAVFPSEDVMQKILDDGAEDALLFTHHPSIWDIRRAPEIFYQMDRDLLEQFKQKRISIYTLHVPLDAYGEYSTSLTLAKALGIEAEKPLVDYFGALYGIIGKTDINTVKQLQEKFANAVGHDVKLYKYGNDEIKNGRVAVAAGGGNDLELVVSKLPDENIDVLVTGVTTINDFSQKTHNFEKENKINVLGGTHYSTEKFACQEMCNYFKKQGLSTQFIPEKPVLEDM